MYVVVCLVTMLRVIISQDGLALSFLALLLLSAWSGWWSATAAAGLVLGMSTVTSHNFFHQKDTFRRYYWDLSMFNSADWQVSHALSHHLHTNTYRYHYFYYTNNKM